MPAPMSYHADLQAKLRQRFGQHGEIAILAVDHQGIDPAEILNEMPCHLTTLRLGGRMPDGLLSSCQTK